MSVVFADTLYWIARIAPDDPYRQAAAEARAQSGDVTLVTTDEVLVEFLTAFARRGGFLRRSAVKAVRAILDDTQVFVVPQTRFTFLAGLQLYENRADKGYSLTDCVSMNVMRAEGITDVLTNDHHFEQEGFRILIRRSAEGD